MRFKHILQFEKMRKSVPLVFMLPLLAVIYAIFSALTGHFIPSGIALAWTPVLLAKNSLSEMLLKLSKAEGDPERNDFFAITKDAATVIEGLRFEAGLSEKDVAEALGIDPQAYLNFVKSGKGVEITPEGVTALSKALKVTPAELAAKMVAGGDEPDADDMQAAPPAQQTTTPATPTDPGMAANKQAKPKAKSQQILMVREAAGSALAVNTGGELMNIAKDAKGNIIKSLDGKPLSLDVMKMQLAGVRKSLDVQKDALLPTDLTEGGVYTPTEAKGIIDLLIADSEILNKVQTFQLPSKKFRVQSHDASNLRSQRLGTGWTNDAREKGASSFLDFELRRVDIEFELLEETIALYSNNVAGLENFIFDMYRQAFMNRIGWLAFNGIGGAADSAIVTNPDAENTLVKGWFAHAQAECDAGMKLVYDNAKTYHDNLKALVASQVATHPEWETAEQLILMSKIDIQNLLDEYEARLDGTIYLAMTQQQIDALTIRGHKMDKYNKIATKNFLYGRYQNFALALLAGNLGGLQVRRYMQPGSIIFRITMWVDFGLVNPVNEIAVMQPAD